MKATFVSKEKNNVNFTMEFSGEEFESAIVDAYKANKGRFAVDGFRKGKAPRKLIETHYGEDIFFEEAINQLFSRNYSVALDELNLEVVDRPTADFSELKKGEGFTVTLSVDVYPDFEVKDYKNLETEEIEVKVSDEEVNKELEMLRQRNSRMVTVERPAKGGDMVLIDYAGFVGDNQFEGGTAESQSLKLGSNTFIPGFEDQLIGASVGEERDVKVTFPEEYHSEELAGKEAIFKCKVHEVKEEELPELDDDFAKDVSEHDTLDALKKEIFDRIEEAATTASKNQMKNALIEKIFHANEVDVPNMMIEEEIDNMMRDLDQQLKQQGMSLEKYVEYLHKDIIEFRAEFREDAFRKVKTRMLISKIAEQEKIEVSQDDIDKDMEKVASHYRMEVEKIKEMFSSQLPLIEKDIKMQKAIELIFESATLVKGA